MQKVENGELDYGNNSERNMRKMLVNSNNNSTNWILKQAGGINSVNRALSKNPYANVLLNEKIVEGIPAGGKAYANLASANDLCRLMTALYNEELPGSEEILKHMKHRKGKGNRIYSGNDIPGGVLVYNKTGSTGHCIGDFGILIPRDDDKVSRPYALAVQVVVPTK
jgi:hypothetical protein